MVKYKMDNGILQVFERIDYDKTFIVDAVAGREYSYASFFYNAISIADYIETNVRSNCFVAVKENSFELALLYFATMFTNKRIAVIDPQKGKSEIQELLNEIEQTGVFADLNEFTQKPSCHFELHYVLADADVDSENVKKCVINRLENRDINAPYLITFTSGTSGHTKGVEHSLKNLFLAALALDSKVNKRKGCFLHVMPMTYMAGILNSLIYPFVTENRIVIDKRFSIASARRFWNTVIAYDVDLFWLSPSMLMMIDQLDRKTIGEDYCREVKPTFLIGTAPLSNDLRNHFDKRYGVKVLASYGLSETLFVSVETPTSIEKSEKDSVGELLEEVKYNISDEGEMLINVPWMFLQYTNVNTEEYFSEKYYKSGDIVNIQNGLLYITGRSKDLIIKGGMNISPVLIENVVNENSKILESVVVGVKDVNSEEKVCCTYVLNSKVENIKEFEASLKKLVLEKLGKNYAIDYLQEIQQTPRNINGKIDRKKIVQMWERESNVSQ